MADKELKTEALFVFLLSRINALESTCSDIFKNNFNINHETFMKSLNHYRSMEQDFLFDAMTRLEMIIEIPQIKEHLEYYRNLDERFL